MTKATKKVAAKPAVKATAKAVVKPAPKASATRTPGAFRRGEEVRYVTIGGGGRSAPRVGRYQGKAQTRTGVFLEIRTQEGRRIRVRPACVEAA